MLLPLYLNNKYTISLSPVIMLLITICLLKSEIKTTNLNSILESNSNLEHSYQAFLIATFLQAIPNYLLLSEPNSVVVTMFQMPIISVYAVIFSPILEEVVFRKILYGEFQKHFLKFSWIAAITSSLIFAMFHFDSRSFIGYFFIGMTFCYFYHKSKTLFTTILAHTYLNFLVILLQSIKHI